MEGASYQPQDDPRGAGSGELEAGARLAVAGTGLPNGAGMADVLTGQKLGPYELHELLGQGGMGAVYRAVHETLEQSRAIKVLPEYFADDPAFVERFRREAAIAAKLHHPNIVQIYDIAERNDLHYIVMQYVDGRSVRDVVRTESPVSVDRGVGILRQLGEALDYAHARGVVHRDIKPGNVLIGHDDHLTLVDFGIARATSEARLTRTGLMVGTPEYMAPEIVTGASEGPSADLYALGVLAYELFTGQVPFGGGDTPAVMYAVVHTPPQSPRELRTDLPRVVEDALLRQLSKDPFDRYPSAGSFVAALEDDISASPQSVWGTVVDLRAEPITPWGALGGGGSTPTPSPTQGRPVSSPTNRPRVGTSTLTPPPSPAPQAARAAATRFTLAEEAATPPPTPSSVTVATPASESRSMAVGLVAVALALIAIGALVAQQLGLIDNIRQSGASMAVAPAPTVLIAQPGPPTGVAVATVAPAALPSAGSPTQIVPTPPALPSAVPPTAVQAAQAAGPPSAQQRLQSARAAVDAGNFGTAIDLLRGIKGSDPDTAGLDEALFEAHLRYGRALVAQGNLDGGEAQLTDALAIRSSDSTAQDALRQVTLARQWAAMEANWGRDDDSAIAALESIMQVDAGYRETRQKLYSLLIAKADRLLAAAEREAALAVLSRALEVQPDGPEARQRLLALTPTPVPEPTPIPPPAAQPSLPQPAAPAQPAPAQPAAPAITKPSAPPSGGANKPFQP